MAPELVVILAILVAVVSAAVAYLIARGRSADERADMKFAEQQHRQAREQAENLRVERDKAQERATELEREYITSLTQRQALDERIGCLIAESKAAQADLQHRQAEVEQLKASLSTEQSRLSESERRVRETNLEVSALTATEGELRAEIQRLKEQLGELSAQKQALQEQATALEAVRKELDQSREHNNQLLEETLRATTAEMLKKTETELVSKAEATLSAASKPVHERLAQMDQQLKEFGSTRVAAEAKLDQQLVTLTEEGVRTRKETRNLVEALKKPQVRGQWGEMHLKRAAELAGLVEHCDFDLQVHFADEESALRPDMVVRLSGGKQVVVDAKVPMAAFMAATEAVEESEAKKHWGDHAKHLRKHVDALGSKEYFRRVAVSPEFVVLFVPSDAFLQPALEHDQSLLEYAVSKRVLITTPTSLIAMLRTIAFAWTQAALQDNLRQIYDLGRELYERLSLMGGHLNKLGGALDRSVKAYNETVGSMESRVFVTARKFHALKVVEGQLIELHAAEQSARPLGSPELVASAMAERAVRALPAAQEDDDAPEEAVG
ncbi:DNA recombination protein RmuC [Nonomuraea sp. NPDC049028]|uniref:DNA recombination protein RmuC n=1 Tax=Nonomuraea sp. NPDC049028 TaxID=3364348 RepID=UPI00371572B5